jgi:antibiotic biosynthesis monooxygenase (ABM) superfamily enzyme
MIHHYAEAMITRHWRGWTVVADADDYEHFLLSELFPSMRTISGFLGADVLRRQEGDEVAFITLSRFRSIDDVRAFAGDALDVAVIEPRAAELLAHFDSRAVHYDTSSYLADRR